MPDSIPGTGERAVVLGASMAGLLAARVLADAYGQVTVVDRDELPEASAQRRGVPQGRHAHALLSRGQQALEELFPGLTAELVAHGATSGDILGNGRWYVNGHLLRQERSGLVGLGASRPLLEAHVRARVRALPNVIFLDGCDIVGLAATPDGRRVTAARVLRQAGAAEQVLDADLVVDATGRGSRAPVWLEALGYPRPERDEVRVRLGYATRTYRLPADVLDGDVAILDAPTPQNPRGGALLALEDGRWIVTLAGILGDFPPTDPDGFLAFARSLRFPDIYQAIRDGEPLDDPVAFRFPASVRHRYERLDRFPDGFLVVGDAVCSFNPIYGQGMSVAALEALALRRHLRRGARLEPRRLLRDLARAVDVPWEIAAGGDLVFPGVQGHRTAKTRLANAYLARLHAAAADDGHLAVTFARVAGLVAPPQSLLRPGVALRVLQGNLGAIGKKSESYELSTLAAPIACQTIQWGKFGRVFEGGHEGLPRLGWLRKGLCRLDPIGKEMADGTPVRNCRHQLLEREGHAEGDADRLVQQHRPARRDRPPRVHLRLRLR